MAAKRPRDEDAGSEAGKPAAQDDSRKPKKAKHGFRVGPENLPDGPWRRKVAKIKKELITKAKVKKQYAKIKAQHQKQVAPAPTADLSNPTATGAAHPGSQPSDHPESAPAPPQIHPDRQAMLDSSRRPKADKRTSSSNKGDHDDSNHASRKIEDDDDAAAAADPSPQPNQEQQQQQPHHHHQQQNNNIDNDENNDSRKKTKKKKKRPDYFSKDLAAAERAKKQAEERAAERARREQERQRRVAERERYRRAMAKAKAPGRDGKRKIGREGKVLLERVRKLVGEAS